ncbi:hypothetical protein Desde_1966 [Desulfitobacterium dehalogenans ATCC 51507]|uniref:4Fe-4S ferredoxin-type domain-containing protein n=1 Tax=Desulfitobacterium dehalogenans (strain ATCC 51507 / DSM 9161 / JW/IU-DC1) TaxID=756499 RepID=I4A8R9_DESDJ|nr:4Fe-4S dicluster domain-containing protein [Desulfitobacterium dehalogenans]AFM00354.1 hypothetical protein Desde_1966 [Desulfitobacterium dehalogenans ATCC 51507]
MPAYILEKLCRGCQRCLRACPREAIKMVAHVAIVEPDQCVECEECMESCMHGAITFRGEDQAGKARQELKQRLMELQTELTDLRARWPAHSLKPSLIIQLEDLEEEIREIREKLANEGMSI